MSIFIQPDAQHDLQAAQDNMLDRWTTDLWLKAEDEIFAKLTDLDTGQINGAPVTELAAVGIRD